MPRFLCLVVLERLEEAGTGRQELSEPTTCAMASKLHVAMKIHGARV
jgi:hypothetical protein